MDSHESRFARDARDFTAHRDAFNIQRCLAVARTQTGKSFGAQVSDIIRLGRADGKLLPAEYYYFRLYDDATYPFEEKRRFLSERIHPAIIKHCCDPDWRAVADDKFLTYSLLQSWGVPVPETQAAYLETGRRFGRVPTLSTTNELTEFLSSAARYPLFVKPLGGIFSLGSCRIDGRDGGTLCLAGTERVSMEAFATQLDRDRGYLFQSVLRPHNELLKYGDAISTVRVILIIENGASEILHTIWKIPGAGNVADNFWRKGNMLAAVDTGSGIIQRVVRGDGPTLEELVDHPDSGARLVGETLPHWKRVIDLVTDNARVFAPIRFQSWDVALCDDGPVVVEVNAGSAFNLSQLAKGEGFLTDRYRDFLLSCGVKLKTRH